MKKSILLLLTVCSLQLVAFSQSDKFTDAMQKNLLLFDSVKTIDDYVKLANTFERIGDAEKTQWLPYYYAALALSNVGWQLSLAGKDDNATKTNAFLDKAEANAGNDSIALSEIEAVRYSPNTQQMQVDPPTRWKIYGMAATQALQKSMAFNPTNPRAYFYKGMDLFFTPPQFGGGKDKAKPLFEKAIALFKTEQPKALYPRWGEKDAERQLALCQ
jgi:hypothetical protein